MKRNIDLTVEGDFQKRRDVLRLQAIAREIRAPILGENYSEKDIRQSEINSNFLTGNKSAVRSKKWKLELHRAGIFAEPTCDRCSGFLYVKSETLCERCDKDMDDEFRNKGLLELLRR